MNRIFEIASSMQKRAWDIIEDTNVIDIWSSVGATINLVGSLKTGLLINNRDIDFHIYTDPFELSGSFSAIAKFAENKRIKTISYTNLLDAEDKCIEWHAFYEENTGELWHIDMIHILKESTYAGYFEKVAERISAVLTEETRASILSIKNEMQEGKKVMGIEVYKAVIEHGVRDLGSFLKWHEQNPNYGIVTWMP